jgi:hypothetical protein
VGGLNVTGWAVCAAYLVGLRVRLCRVTTRRWYLPIGPICPCDDDNLHAEWKKSPLALLLLRHNVSVLQ